jgi:isocitrate/isopropylmalate dehydrogenase
MIFEHFGMKDAAEIVEECILRAIISGICTPDLGGHSGTKEFGDKILECIRRRDS